jgi:hypothetical protein
MRRNLRLVVVRVNENVLFIEQAIAEEFSLPDLLDGKKLCRLKQSGRDKV